MRVTGRITVPGLHRWPGAPPARAYLASTHRHLFWVTATVDVINPEREVEFHDLAAIITDCLPGHPYPQDVTMLDFGPLSCESIATLIASAMTDRGHPPAQVTVSEDNEFTATWESQ